MIDGLRRYNEIQKALSSLKKSGVRFGASFHQTASQIYKTTKDQPIKHVINNIDKVYENLIPELPSEFHDEHPFFNYDGYNKNGQGIIFSQQWPKNLKVKAPQLKGEDWVGEDTEVDFDVMFKEFSDYINKNRTVFWDNSSDAPRFFFSEITWDNFEKSYTTTLYIDRDDAYGYEPGVEAYENREVARSEIKELPEDEEEEIEEVIEVPEKKKLKKLAPDKEEKAIRKIKAETDKIKAETAKEKASAKKISELNKAIDRYDSMLERKLITKKQYNQFISNLSKL